MDTGKLILLLFILALVLGLVLYIRSKFKIPKIPCVAMISGAPKTGKTTFGVAMALKNYKSRHRAWKIRSKFQKLFRMPISEEPLLYSNIPLTIPYSPLTRDLLLREKRFNYGSVVFISEASLVCDSQLIKDQELNQDLLYFFKLCGHELHGGNIIIESQTIADVHYSIKRCLSNYFYIHHIVRLPFFLLCFVREDRYSEDNSMISVNSADTEDSLKRVLIPKRTWKYFDCYTYSILTDQLQVDNQLMIGDSKNLKSNNIVSFRPNVGRIKEKK